MTSPGPRGLHSQARALLSALVWICVSFFYLRACFSALRIRQLCSHIGFNTVPLECMFFGHLFCLDKVQDHSVFPHAYYTFVTSTLIPGIISQSKISKQYCGPKKPYQTFVTLCLCGCFFTCMISLYK